jgi:hypothetical protein
MTMETAIAMIRCHLDAENHSARDTRYIPAAEFDLWRYFMETKHARIVTVDAVSVWLPEAPGILDGEIDAEALEPVLRVCFEKPGPEGTLVPVVRFFPTETYPQARAALLAHFDPRCRWSVQATPGYFIASSSGSDRVRAAEAVA